MEKDHGGLGYAVWDVKYFQLPVTRDLRRGFYDQFIRFIYRKSGENNKRGSYKSGKRMKSGGMKRTITVGLLFAGHMFQTSKINKGNWRGDLCVEVVSELRKQIDQKFPDLKNKSIKLFSDGDPVMTSKKACQSFLQNNFEIVLSPSRSPDLNALDFWTWDCVSKKYKEKIKEKVGNMDDNDGEKKHRLSNKELLEFIDSSCKELTPDEIRKAMKSLIGRIRKCIFVRGGRFEGQTFSDSEKQTMQNYE